MRTLPALTALPPHPHPPLGRCRYIKVVGGLPGREGLLVGLKGGGVLQVFVDNPFPVTLVQHGGPVRCLDLSADRGRLAVVDDHQLLSVYDLASKVGSGGGCSREMEMAVGDVDCKQHAGAGLELPCIPAPG